MSAALRQWLDTLGLAQYGDRFAADDIDLDVLPSLSEQDLEKLGVSMGHRKRLLKAIAELTGAPAPPAASGTMAATTPQPAEPAEARKVVTIVFADLVGSTGLHERLDPESARRFMERYYAAMRGAVEGQGGTVTQLLGDGVKAVFGAPRVAEDDAIRAVRAAVAMQVAFRALAEEQRGAVGKTGLRVAVNTGEVVASETAEIIGDPVNVAARLQEQGRDGDVVIGEATRRMVAALVTLVPLGRFALKGRAEAMNAYRVVSLERPAGATPAAFVGRDDELARITAVYEAARATPAGRLAVLLGSPGLGKSRLIAEFTHRLGDAASVVTAHCDAEGGATFAPVAAALREFLHLEAGASPQAAQAAIEAAIPATDAERPRIAAGIAALLAGSPASPEETFFIIRRLLAGLAAARPVVLVIDDLHWAEPLLLDLVEHLVQWGSGTPLLVLVGGRPELRDLRSSLVTPGGLVSDVVTLSGLDAGAAMRLAANVIGAADLPAAVAAKVLATSEGNPLFVGELVRMLVDEGAIERQGERWIVGANLAALEMPPTIHALLAARIERLRPEERSVLERAAVVGRHFSRSAVAALLGRNGTELDAWLEALRRKELIERDTGWFLGEPVLRFHHVLIRDAAYRRLLKGTRAELHEQLADWIEAQVKDAAEHDETIGWHLEQAHQHRRELGPLDAQGKTLGERAAAKLAAAGRRALARDDLPVAAGLLGRALERLDPEDPTRAELALDWCEALLAGGDVGTAAKAIEELGRFMGSPTRAPAPRLAAWRTCFTGQLTVLTAPQALHTTADAVAAAAEELASLGDAAGEAKGHFVHALALARLGKVAGCEAALDKALAAARRADDRRRANTVLAIAPLAALWGPSPVTRASGRCLDVVRVLRITQGAPAVEAVALSCQAVLEALRGRADAGRRMLASARKMVEDLGITQRLLEADVLGGLIDLLEGDAVAAEHSLRRAYDGLRDLGLGIDAARAAALLARAQLAQDRGAEAEALSHESEALAGDDLKAAIAWRGVRAEALAQRGEHAAAVELAQEAVGIASATDALLDHADARLALAVALRAAGRGAEAAAEKGRAVELWEAKGATLLVERARRSSARTGTPTNEPVAGPPVASTIRDGELPGRGAMDSPSSRAPLAPVGRRLRTNAATENIERFGVAVAAHDLDGLARELCEDVEVVHHQTGATYGREAFLVTWRSLFRADKMIRRQEPIASLGDSLALAHHTISLEGFAEAHIAAAGPVEIDEVVLFEVDERGRDRRFDIFPTEKLGAAIARLYERFAELLPAGAPRARAAATARSVAGWNGPIDPDRLATTMTPSIEVVDHRNLGTWSTRGAAEFLDHVRLQTQLATGFTGRTDGLVALASDALLVRSTYFGSARDSCGAFENVLLQLFAFGADGLIARVELWEPDHDAEALARFDALTADARHAGTLAAGIQEGGADSRPKIAGMTERSRLVSGRRVRPNAATAWRARFDAALAARDFEAVAAGLHEEFREIDHPTGSDYGRDAAVASLKRLFRSRAPYYEVEPLATLGERLLLTRRRTGAGGDTRGRYDVGPYENEAIEVTEVDAHGLSYRQEVFAADRLGAALVRLYERYAELLPAGAQRARAAGIARSLAAYDGRADLERLKAAYAPTHDGIDHRVFGPWSAENAAEILRHFRLQLDLAPDFAARYDDVVAANERALVARMTFFGTARDSGGPFENKLCFLFRFGADGRLTHTECREAEQVVETLARFDEVIEGDTAAVADWFENAAARTDRELFERFNARDWAGVEALAAPELVFDERRRMVRNTCGRDIWLEQFRILFDVPASRFTSRLLATRGERLALNLHCFEGQVADGGGPLAMEDHLALHGVDGDGRIVAIVLFDLEDQDAACAELDARFDAGEAAAHRPSWESVRGFVRAVARRDWDAVAALCAETLVEYDHRGLAVIGTTRGAEAWALNFSTLVDLSPDTVYRVDHFRAGARGYYSHGGWHGTGEGGPFENCFLWLGELDERGRYQRFDLYDLDQVDAALARFAELCAVRGT